MKIRFVLLAAALALLLAGCQAETPPESSPSPPAETVLETDTARTENT